MHSLTRDNSQLTMTMPNQTRPQYLFHAFLKQELDLLKLKTAEQQQINRNLLVSRVTRRDGTALSRQMSCRSQLMVV